MSLQQESNSTIDLWTNWNSRIQQLENDLYKTDLNTDFYAKELLGITTAKPSEDARTLKQGYSRCQADLGQGKKSNLDQNKVFEN